MERKVIIALFSTYLIVMISLYAAAYVDSHIIPEWIILILIVITLPISTVTLSWQLKHLKKTKRQLAIQKWHSAKNLTPRQWKLIGIYVFGFGSLLYTFMNAIQKIQCLGMYMQNPTVLNATTNKTVYLIKQDDYQNFKRKQILSTIYHILYFFFVLVQISVLHTFESLTDTGPISIKPSKKAMITSSCVIIFANISIWCRIFDYDTDELFSPRINYFKNIKPGFLDDNTLKSVCFNFLPLRTFVEGTLTSILFPFIMGFSIGAIHTQWHVINWCITTRTMTEYHTDTERVDTEMQETDLLINSDSTTYSSSLDSETTNPDKQSCFISIIKPLLAVPSAILLTIARTAMMFIFTILATSDTPFYKTPEGSTYLVQYFGITTDLLEFLQYSTLMISLLLLGYLIQGKSNFKPKAASAPILFIISAILGPFLFSFINIGSLSVEVLQKRNSTSSTAWQDSNIYTTILASMVNVFETILQVLLTVKACKLTVKREYSDSSYKTVQQILSFLIVMNFGLWVNDTFLLKQSHTLKLDQLNFSNVSVNIVVLILAVSRPFCVYYRFLSVGLFLKIKSDLSQERKTGPHLM